MNSSMSLHRHLFRIHATAKIGRYQHLVLSYFLRRAFGDEHPAVAQTMNNLANLYREQHRFAAAARRGELTDAEPAQVLADYFLANIFSVAIGWSHDQSFPLDVALQGAAYLFLHGASART